MNNKICNKCLIEKPIMEFSSRKDSKDGYRNDCKLCYKITKNTWRDNNSESIKLKDRERSKIYYLANITNKKEYSKKYNSEYRKNNKDKIREYQKEWLNNNKEYFKEHKKEYRLLNKNKIKEYKSRYERNKKSIDNIYRLKSNIRTVLSQSFNNNGYKKKSKTEEIIGCSYENLKLHLEARFESWMTWDNYGLYNGEFNYGWDIDHIIPLSSGKLEKDVIRLNHYTNLQPLCSYINRVVKRDYLPLG